jgi:hypothetical protein
MAQTLPLIKSVVDFSSEVLLWLVPLAPPVQQFLL